MNKKITVSLLIIASISLAGCGSNGHKIQPSGNVKDNVNSSTASSSKDKPSDTVKSVDQEVTYKVYGNARYGFFIQYPDNFIVKQTSENGDGIILVSPDGSAELTVYGSNNVFNETASSGYSDLLKQHSDASYKEQKSNWFAVSWTEGDKIVYEKDVVGSDSINAFIFKYPAAQKDLYDQIVSELNSTFKTTRIDTSH